MSFSPTGDSVTGIVSGPIVLVGVEALSIIGNGGTDIVSLNNLGTSTGLKTLLLSAATASSLAVTGTANSDTFTVAPTAAGAGTMRTAAGPLVTYAGFGGNVTAHGGAAGFDVLALIGDDSPNTVTDGPTSVTLNGGTITLGSNLSRLEVATGGGQDSITFDELTLAIPVVIDAGDGDDIVAANGSAGSFTIYGGGGADNISGSGQADTIDAGTGNDTVQAGAGDDQVLGGDGNDLLDSGTGVDTILAGDGSDTITGGSGNDVLLGGEAADTFLWNQGDGNDVVEGQAGQDIVVFSGDAAATDTIFLSALGTRVALTRTQGSVDLSMAGIETVRLNGGSGSGGADAFTVGTLTGTEVQLVEIDLGVVGDADQVTVQGSAASESMNATTDGSEILVGGLIPAVRIVRGTATEDQLQLNGHAGHDTITVGAGVSSWARVTVDGGDGDDILSAEGPATLRGNSGNDRLTGSSGDDTLEGGSGDDVYAGGGGSDAITDPSGNDTILVAGTNGQDIITLSSNPAGTDLIVTVNGLTTIYENAFAAGIERVEVSAGSGDDLLVVNSAHGAIRFSQGIAYDGGAGTDTLQLEGGVASSNVYSPGPGPGQGTSQLVIGGNTQRIVFANLEPVIDLVGGPIQIQGTAADNTISYSAATAARGRVEIDNFERLDFENKTDVTIRGEAGRDTFSLAPANSGFSGAMTVQGGEPVDGDVLLVRQAASATNVNIDLSTTQITGVLPGRLLAFDSIEEVSVIGAAGTSQLAVTGAAFYDILPLAALDEGRILSDSIPIAFRGFGAGDLVTLSTTISPRRVTVHGTASADEISVEATGRIAIAGRATVAPVGVTDIAVNSLGGGDVLSVAGGHGYATVSLQAGDGASNDRATLRGDGSTTTAVTLGGLATTVAGGGLGTVAVTGIASLAVSNSGGANDAILFDGTSLSEVFQVAPSGADSARIQVGTQLPVVDATTAGPLVIQAAGGGDDVLAIQLTSAAESVAIDETAVQISAGATLKTIQYAAGNIDLLRVRTGAGQDTITVATSSATPPIFLDGEDPIGGIPGDQVVLQSSGLPVQFHAGPESDEGSFQVGTHAPVSFDHLENATVFGGAPGSSVTITGTNGSDSISVIARDGSYHPLADGRQDFSVAVNGCPQLALLFLDMPAVNLQGRAGNVHSSVRTRAPNAAVWDVEVSVDGGVPSTTGDQLVIETPFGNVDIVRYTPGTGPDSGILWIDATNDGDSPDDTHVVINAIETLRYDGESGPDQLTVAGSGADDAFLFTAGPAADEGHLRVNQTLSIQFEQLGANGLLRIDGEGQTQADSLTVLGTQANDVWTVGNPSGINTVVLATGAVAHLALHQTGIETLRLDGQGGDDLFQVENNVLPYTGGIFLDGNGPASADRVVVRGRANADDVVELSLSSTNDVITGAVGGIITLTGVEQLSVLSDSGNDQLSVRGLGGTSQLQSVRLDAGGDAADRFTLHGSSGADSIAITPFSPTEVVAAAPGAGPVVTVTLHSAATSTFTVNGEGGEDLVTVNGSVQSELIRVHRTAGASSVDVGGWKRVTLVENSPNQLLVDARLGADTIHITGSGGPELHVQGGGPGAQGGDRLVVEGDEGTANTFVLAPGFAMGEGVISRNGEGTRFSGIDNVTLDANGGGSGPDRLEVAGTDGHDVFTLRANVGVDGNTTVASGGSLATSFLPAIVFQEFDNLAGPSATSVLLRGRGGDDSFTVYQAADWAVRRIELDGGAPGASDSAQILGDASQDDAFVYTPTSINSGELAVTSGSATTLVALTAVEALSVDARGQLAADSLAVTTNQAVIVPAFPPGSGSIQPASGSGAAFLALAYQHIETTSISGSTAVIEGTAGDDTFTITAAGVVTITNTLGFANTVDVAGFDRVIVHTYAGTDRVVVEPGTLFAQGITVLGGDPGPGSDSVVATVSANGASTLALGSSPDTLSGIIGGLISLQGVEHVRVAGSNAVLNSFAITGWGAATELQSIELDGGDQDNNDLDTLVITQTDASQDTTYEPASTQGGTLQQAGAPVLTFTGLNNSPGALTLQGGGGQDTLQVRGSAVSQRILVNAGDGIATDGSVIVDADTIAANGNELVPIRFNTTGAGSTGQTISALSVWGLDGQDTFQVTAGAIPIRADGGDPIGTSAGDQIVVLAGGSAVAFEPGPESDEGGFVMSGRERVSFDHIESATINSAATGTTVSSTDADDSVTIVARDQTTHAGADGVNDFTTVINNGLEVLWLNTPAFTVRTQGGQDAIAIQAPSPQPAGAWDVDLTIDAGLPSGGDTVHITTPGTNQLAYTPSAADGGTLSLLDLSSVTTLLGVDRLVYDGGAGSDVVTLRGSTGDDAIRLTPTASDAAVVRVNSTLPLEAISLGAASTVTVDGLGGADELRYDGRSLDDRFEVAAGGGGSAVDLNDFRRVFGLNVEMLTLLGGDGSDSFRIATSAAFASVRVEAGNPSHAGDSLVVAGTAGVDDALDVSQAGAGTGTITETITGKAYSFTGVESLAVEGNGSEDRLTVADTAADDQILLTAGEPGDRLIAATWAPLDVLGQFQTLSVALDRRSGNDRLTVELARLRSSALYTVTARASELDELIVLGSDGDDRVAGTSTNVTMSRDGGARTLGFVSGHLHGITIRTLGGNDSIVLNGLAEPRRIEAGAGHDYIEDQGVTPATLLGEDGDDTVRAGRGADTVDGGRGNDFLFGGDGNDAILGGEGNDFLVGGAGNDSVSGGDGSDRILWTPGDGNDSVEGDGGADFVLFTGGSVADTFQLSAAGSRLRLERQPGSVAIDAGGIEQLDTNTSLALSGTFAGNQVVPPTSSTAYGAAHLVFDSITGTFELDIYLQGIRTAELAGSHLRAGAPGTEGASLIDLGSGSLWTEELGGLRRRVSTANVPAANLADLLAGNTYLSIDTIAFSDGEVRAQLNRVGSAANLGGADIFVVRDLTQTGVRVVNLGLGVLDAGEIDQVTLHGRNTADTVTVAMNSDQVNVVGLAYDINLSNSGVGEDLLTLLGNDGDDSLTVQDGLSARFGVNQITVDGGRGRDAITGFGTLQGGEGDDLLTGNDAGQILRGGDGNDTIWGGGGDDQLFGEAGEDALVGGAGEDRLDGGSAFDTLLVMGTSGADTVDIQQLTDSSVRHIVNGDTQSDTLVAGSVEELRVEAGSGADTIRVAVIDSLFDDPGLSLQITVDGGAATGAGDRLIVIDDGTDDLVVYRKVESAADGTVTVGPANAEPFEHVFTGIERLQVVDETGAALNAGNGAGARLITIGFDAYELNDDRFEATHLGTSGTLPSDPAIDAVGLTSPFQDAFDVAGDNDWYRVEAIVNGTLDIRVFFDEIGSIGTRPGLPGNGNLDVELYDADGTRIAGHGTFGDNDGPAEFNPDGDAFGEDERIRIPTVQGQVYYVRVFGATSSAVNNYSITVIQQSVPTPYGLELQDSPQGSHSDTGSSASDNLTQDSTPTIFLRLDDGSLRFDVPGNDSSGNPPDQRIPIPHQGSAGPAGFRVGVFDEGSTPAQTTTNPQTPVGFAEEIPGSPGLYSFTFPAPLSNGSHFVSARVQLTDPSTPAQTGWGGRSQPLEIVVDAIGSPTFFGVAATNVDGLDATSDSGLSGRPETAADRITSETKPSFWGTSEAGTIIRLYADVNGNGIVDASDVLLGVTTADPRGGTHEVPNGEWHITSRVDLNDPSLFTQDGTRRLLVTAEDNAGNISAPDTLSIFLDTRGVRVTDVDINTRGNPHNIYNPLPSVDGPTPPVTALVLTVADAPNRAAAVGSGFLSPALAASLATNPGHYSLVGDHSGAIAIQSVVYAQDALASGQPATATITLNFASPLPDDRYTLQLSDQLRDVAGNRLDGEGNFGEPQANPAFPSGDGTAGGVFVTRFTVDSRPEIGVFTGSSVQVDANGNFVFDPEGQDHDATNRDLVFAIGISSDTPFNGDFTPGLATASSGFEKLGVYGVANQVWRFLLDFNHDGTADFMSVPHASFQSASAPGIQGSPIATYALPAAGNFSTAKAGDEIALFDPFNLSLAPIGSRPRWILDSNGDNLLMPGDTVIELDIENSFTELVLPNPTFPTIAARAARLVPFVGDFNGDGQDDLGIFDRQLNRFSFDLDRDGRRDDSIEFGFDDPGLPVVGDFNLDGIDDVGLWLPDSPLPAPGIPDAPNQVRDGVGEWYVLVSDRAGATPSAIFDAFAPVPLGNDVFARFGATGGLPVFGNFDPPPHTDAATSPTGGMFNPRDRFDANADGSITPLDVLLIVNALNEVGPGQLPDRVFTQPRFAAPRAYVDANRDGSLSAIDALVIINRLNAGSGEAQGESRAEEAGTDGGSILAMMPSVDGGPLAPVREHVQDDQKLPAGESTRAPGAVVIDTPDVETSWVLVDAALADLEAPADLLAGDGLILQEDDPLDIVFGEW
ncbi:MAG: Ig-like domain-containing protein [Pirellulaceae bacterium]